MAIRLNDCSVVVAPTTWGSEPTISIPSAQELRCTSIEITETPKWGNSKEMTGNPDEAKKTPIEYDYSVKPKFAVHFDDPGAMAVIAAAIGEMGTPSLLSAATAGHPNIYSIAINQTYDTFKAVAVGLNDLTDATNSPHGVLVVPSSVNKTLKLSCDDAELRAEVDNIASGFLLHSTVNATAFTFSGGRLETSGKVPRFTGTIRMNDRDDTALDSGDELTGVKAFIYDLDTAANEDHVFGQTGVQEPLRSGKGFRKGKISLSMTRKENQQFFADLKAGQLKKMDITFASEDGIGDSTIPYSIRLRFPNVQIVSAPPANRTGEGLIPENLELECLTSDGTSAGMTDITLGSKAHVKGRWISIQATKLTA